MPLTEEQTKSLEWIAFGVSVLAIGLNLYLIYTRTKGTGTITRALARTAAGLM